MAKRRADDNLAGAPLQQKAAPKKAKPVETEQEKVEEQKEIHSQQHLVGSIHQLQDTKSYYRQQERQQ